jgi:hypothetical protein
MKLRCCTRCLVLAAIIGFAVCVGAHAVEFPIQIDSTGHYFVDNSGSPFMYHGTTPWYLLVTPSKEDATFYLDDAKERGWTVLQVMLCNQDRDRNYYGEPAFLDDGMNEPNPAYFDHAEWLVQEAGKRGIIIAFQSVWIGWPDCGAWRCLMTTENMKAFGTFLGGRFGKYNNVIWIHGGDDCPGDLAQAMVEIGNQIQILAPSQLQTYHGCGPTSTGVLPNDAWIDFNCAYVYHNTYEQILIDFKHVPPMPTIMGESGYENEANDQRPGTPHRVRRQAWWAMFCGAAGHAYGAGGQWNWSPNWKETLKNPGLLQLAHLKSFVTSIPWQTLVADTKHEALTAGYGQFMGGEPDETSYVTAAWTKDGSFVVAYLPSPRTVTVDMSRLNAKATAQWFDPTDGSYTTINGSPFDNTGTREFTPPDRNDFGDGDWVLKIEGNIDTSGPITPAKAGPAVADRDPGMARIVQDGRNILLRYILVEASNIAIQITDNNGRIVFAVPSRVEAAGNHELRWDRGRLAPGFYYVSVVRGNSALRRGIAAVR